MGVEAPSLAWITIHRPTCKQEEPAMSVVLSRRQKAGAMLVSPLLWTAVLVGCGGGGGGGGGGRQTTDLESKSVTDENTAIAWIQSGDYYVATVTNAQGSLNRVYAGEFNMTGSKLGIGPIDVTMRSAHTATDLYLSVSWHDATGSNDLNRRRWYYNLADILPPSGFIPGFNEVTPVQTGWSVNLN